MTKLKKLRLLGGINQFKLANMAGVHQSRISLIENHLVHATDDEKKRLAQALGVTVDKIFPEVKSKAA